MIKRRLFAVLLVYLSLVLLSFGQQPVVRRTINISYTSANASILALSKGRVLWSETNSITSQLDLMLFTGAEIFKLDSGLASVTGALDGNDAVWNTGGEEVHAFHAGTWESHLIGLSYNPDGRQRISVNGGILAYSGRKGGTGSYVRLFNIPDSTFTEMDEGTWNTQPSFDQGELAWVVSSSESLAAPSDIWWCNGLSCRKVSSDSPLRRVHPLVKDGALLYREDSAGIGRVHLALTDTLLKIAETGSPAEIITGYDLSDGVAVVGLTDTSAHTGKLIIFDSELMTPRAIVETTAVHSPHIDNGMVVWQAGDPPGQSIEWMLTGDSSATSAGAGALPLVDDGVFSWALGDALEMNIPLATRQLTTDQKNGWEQSRFCPIHNGRVIYGNFESSLHSRLMYDDGSGPVKLTDSTGVRDFVMMNDGHAIWRENSDSLWMYDGSGTPVKLLDSLQVENMYVSGRRISFTGFRLQGGSSVPQAWVLETSTLTLTQLTFDTAGAKSTVAICDSDAVVWNRDSAGSFLIMYFDGTATRRLSTNDSAGFTFGFRNGVAVWSQINQGVEQIMMFSRSTGVTAQISSGTEGCTRPGTDGSVVVWTRGTGAQQILEYYSIPSGRLTKVCHVSPQNFRFPWVDRGKVVWPLGGDIFLFDGTAISQLSTTGQFPPKREPYIAQEQVVWNGIDVSNPSSEPRGNIFVGTLSAVPSFEADRLVGPGPLQVSFTNLSWQGDRSYHWDFGDGGTGISKDAQHTYAVPGTYSVTLTVDGPTGTRIERKYHLVTVYSSTSVNEKGLSLPARYELSANYPNPFNPDTRIDISIPIRSDVRIAVYNLLGEEVSVIFSGSHAPGRYTIPWKSGNEAAGTYFIRMTAPGFETVRKVALVK